MLIVTTDGVAGYEIRGVLGEVFGTGEQPGASLSGARREAMDRLGAEAWRKGANAVVGMRFDTAPAGGGVEVCAYGTAVWAEPAAQHREQPHRCRQPPRQGPVPPYGDPQAGAPPMAARNLTMGLHDRPR